MKGAYRYDFNARGLYTDAKSIDDHSFRRTGLFKEAFNMPEGFDEHFDDMNDEIAKMFLGC